MTILLEIEKAFSTYIRNQTHPLAVKMLSGEDEIPGAAKRPLKDFGAPFTLCQAIGLSRKEGLNIALDRESLSCPIALAGLGFVEPEEFLSGKYPLAPINQAVDARRNIAGALPRFPLGKYRSILIAPVGTADFEPDLIVFYGSSAQVMRLIQAAVFASGEGLTSRSMGTGGCLLPVVAPVLEGECKFAVPGNGDRRMGLVADGEIAFAMPKNRFEEVVAGLKLSHEGKQSYPIGPGYLKLEYKMPPPYVALRKALIERS
ncbi:MAG: DUF169 domain-containing protein [Desulfobacterales bacterium]|nr:DUF169 domain-containing protein [Desulfobacterales bacterium]